MIDWKKWPNEKPPVSGRYLTVAKFSELNDLKDAGVFTMKYRTDTDEWDWGEIVLPSYWAEINWPCESEPFIPFVTGNSGEQRGIY